MERRFLRFLKLSGVTADGMVEDSARAARMDEGVVWETEG